MIERAAAWALLGLFFLSVAPVVNSAQSMQEGSHAGHGMVGWVPQEVLEGRIPLRQGIGRLHDPVTTTSRDAQAFYDQGMSYLMSYVWIEAARSFHQALRLDPKVAMAYVGLSDAYLGLQDNAAAHSAFDKANELAAGVTERERRRIAIRNAQFAFLDDSRNVQKYFAYRKAIEDAIGADPADPILWLLRGFAEEGTPFAHGQSGGVLSIAIYEAALARSPDNFAAHHFLTHTLENLGRYDEALQHAEAYIRLSPSIPHAHHMLGHILRRVARTGDAIQQFLEADALEKAYYRAEGLPAEWDWHHAHNLSLLGVSYEYLGQMKAAEPLLQGAFALPAYTDFGEYNRKEWPEFLLSRGRAQEALEAAQTMAHGKWTPGRAAGHALAGRALLALNRPEDARGELASAEQEMQSLANPIAVMPYVEGLRGQLALHQQNQAEGAELLKKAEETMRRVSGPDTWTQTLFWLESMACVARESGEWELAEYTAQQMLLQDPAYPGSHLAMALVEEHRGDAATAHREFAQADKLWKGADSDLAELAIVRRKLAAEP